jgi:hypothetical protein
MPTASDLYNRPPTPDERMAMECGGGDNMTEDQIALHAAINVLRDSIESRRMPSREPLPPDSIALHERAAQHLEAVLRQPPAGLN